MLGEMGRRHGTDKWDVSHSFLGESYLDVYERYLGSLRNQPVTVLELGVKAGGSLRMWKEYFSRGAIHGLDLNPRCQEATEERITVHTLSQDDEAGLTALAEAVGGFDLVLDDASHINALTAASFRILWPHVKAGGFYIIEDLGMSRVDYARIEDQDTFMDGELKMNLDRGVSPHQDRSTLDAVFGDILRALDNRCGPARFLHFWSGTAILQRGAPTERVVEQPTATPHLCVTELLPADRYRALVDRVDHDLGDSWSDVEAAIRAVSGLARRELGLAHFSVDGVAATLTVHRDDAVFHTAPLGTPGPGTRRIDFVYNFSPDPGAFEGGQLRLYDTEDRDGSRCAAASFTAIDGVDNAVVLFPSDAPHDVVPLTPRREGAMRYTLDGWLTGEPVSPGRVTQRPSTASPP